MKKIFVPLPLVLALGAPGLAQGDAPGPLRQSYQGQNNNNQGQNNQGQNNQGGYRGAPGPLVGAGLPVLLVAGGIYWIMRRRKSPSGD